MKVSLLQNSIEWENREANLLAWSTQIAGIREPTDLIVLPEMFNSGFTMNTKDCGEPMDGPTIRWMQEQAKRKQAAIAGSLIIQEQDHYYNRFIFMLADGSLHQYDKKHRFAMAEEDHYFEAGVCNISIPYKEFRIRPQICYDLRFPVWARHTEEVSYDLLLYVACWPERRSHHWRSLLPARAIENQSYVIAVNRNGTDGKGITYRGDSCVLDPLGNKILDLEDRSACESVELHISEVQSVRKQLPFLKDADTFRLES